MGFGSNSPSAAPPLLGLPASYGNICKNYMKYAENYINFALREWPNEGRMHYTYASVAGAPPPLDRRVRYTKIMKAEARSLLDGRGISGVTGDNNVPIIKA